jgi:threonine dehydrogenase-like Zn-dependent dehydrogenase
MITAYTYQLSGPFELKLIESEIEEETFLPDELICKTLYSVVSPGTELAAFRGDPPLRPGKVYPRVLGYCNVAEVQHSVAESDFRKGDYILTFQSHRTHFKIKTRDVILKFDKETFRKEFAALYLFHLGYNALLGADVKPGHKVAVIGMGVLGTTTALMSNIAGCITHCFTNQDGVYKTIGIENLYSKDSYDPSIFADTQGADIVINTSNSWSDWLLGLKIARKGGVIVAVGFPGRGQGVPAFNPLDSQYFYDKQLTLKATGYYSDIEVPSEDIRFTLKRNMRYLYDLSLENKLRPESILTEEIAWRELPDLYRNVSMKQQRGLTHLIKW